MNYHKKGENLFFLHSKTVNQETAKEIKKYWKYENTNKEDPQTKYKVAVIMSQSNDKIPCQNSDKQTWSAIKVEICIKCEKMCYGEFQLK